MMNIDILFSRINEPNGDIQDKNDLILSLVDNYKSEKIFPFLIVLIKSVNVSEIDGTWVYACHEYDIKLCSLYADLWIEIVVKSNYEASYAASSILSDLESILSIKLTPNQMNYLHLSLKSVNDENFEIIQNVLFYFNHE